MGYALVVEVPIPGDELRTVFAWTPSQHNAVKICQHPVAILKTVHLQNRCPLHLIHILGYGSGDAVDLVLGSDPFRCTDVCHSVGNTAALRYLAQRQAIKQDTQSASAYPVRQEALSGALIFIWLLLKRKKSADSMVLRNQQIDAP